MIWNSLNYFIKLLGKTIRPWKFRHFTSCTHGGWWHHMPSFTHCVTGPISHSELSKFSSLSISSFCISLWKYKLFAIHFNQLDLILNPTVWCLLKTVPCAVQKSLNSSDMEYCSSETNFYSEVFHVFLMPLWFLSFIDDFSVSGGITWSLAFSDLS